MWLSPHRCVLLHISVEITKHVWENPHRQVLGFFHTCLVKHTHRLISPWADGDMTQTVIRRPPSQFFYVFSPVSVNFLTVAYILCISGPLTGVSSFVPRQLCSIPAPPQWAGWRAWTHWGRGSRPGLQLYSLPPAAQYHHGMFVVKCLSVERRYRYIDVLNWDTWIYLGSWIYLGTWMY